MSPGSSRPDPAAAASGSGPSTSNGGASSFDRAKAEARSAFSTIADRFGEIRDYAGYYAQTRTDAVKLKATRIGIYAGIGLVAAVIGLAALATAGVLLVRGIAHGLGAAFGHLWLGELVTGIALIALVLGGGLIGMKIVTASAKKKLMAKYEKLHESQRDRFGADVLQRAREAEVN